MDRNINKLWLFVFGRVRMGAGYQAYLLLPGCYSGSNNRKYQP
tara:strand:+ start:219 stop:347 length:129 start_codon:yes stop_codon:yes gene_type:complete